VREQGYKKVCKKFLDLRAGLRWAGQEGEAGGKELNKTSICGGTSVRNWQHPPNSLKTKSKKGAVKAVVAPGTRGGVHKNHHEASEAGASRYGIP